MKGNHSNVTLSGNGTRTIFRGYVTASMLLDKVKVSVTIAFDTYMESTRLFVQLDMVYTKTFDNGMSLYMTVGGNIIVPCTELGDVSAYGKLRLEDIPVGPNGNIKMIRSSVNFQSNCNSHQKFYADISLLDEDGRGGVENKPTRPMWNPSTL